MKKTIRESSVLLAALCLLAVASCNSKPEQREEDSISVTVEKVTPSAEYAKRPYVGVIEEESATSVSFTGMAMLKTVTVGEGQPVRKGQLLAVIDETQARNALATAKASLDQALDARERMRQLHDNQSLPDMKWVEVESKVQQAQASYDMMKKNLEDCRIYAPVSGVVGTKIMGVGETVLPTEPVLTILSIDRVKVRVAIPEREIAGITNGTATEISVDALPGEAFHGGRIEKGVTADPLTHTYDIRILVPNPGHKLLPGMVARVRLDLSLPSKGNSGKFALPVRAVQQSGDHSLFVWVVKNGRAHRQTVTVGQTVGNRVVIESGVGEGEEVVVEGYQKLGEGTPVMK